MTDPIMSNTERPVPSLEQVSESRPSSYAPAHCVTYFPSTYKADIPSTRRYVSCDLLARCKWMNLEIGYTWSGSRLPHMGSQKTLQQDRNFLIVVIPDFGWKNRSRPYGVKALVWTLVMELVKTNAKWLISAWLRVPQKEIESVRILCCKNCKHNRRLRATQRSPAARIDRIYYQSAEAWTQRYLPERSHSLKNKENV